MEQESLTLRMPLTEEEQQDLIRREEYIEDNLQTLFSVGKAFADIRDRKLYRETHRTFEDYCKDRWQISRPRAYQLIDASVVQENLSTNVDKGTPLPTNESQTRALKKAPPEKQLDIWQKAVAQNDGRVPSARQIIQVVELEQPKPKPQPGEYYESRTYKAVKILQYDGDVDTVYIQEMIKGEKRWISRAELGASCSEEYVLSTTESEDRLYFEMLFDMNDEGVCERLKRIVFRSEIYNVPFTSQEADDKGWCETCPYSYSTHYLNEKGVKWCTLAVMNDLTLREVLKAEKIKIYTTTTVPQPPAIEEPEPEPEQQAERREASEDRLERCDFCGKLQELYWDPKNTWATICLKCAQKAVVALDPKDERAERDNVGFEPRRAGDLDKILRAGIFRIFRIDDYAKIIKEYSKAKSTIAEGTAITWGSWKTFEKFETKKAMYERAAELQQDEHVIFEGKA